MELTFLGGNDTVTGSSTLLRISDKKIIVDMGIMQSNGGIEGFKKAHQFNSRDFEYDPKEIDAVFLTHAHIDHIGRVPLIIDKKPEIDIICTEPTANLGALNIKDSAYLNQKECDRMNKRLGCNNFKPIYTEEEVSSIENKFKCYDYHQKIFIKQNHEEEIYGELIPAGHMIGSASIKITHKTSFYEKSYFFTGDTSGQSNRIPYTKPCPKIKEVDYIITESTYGNRKHKKIDFKETLYLYIKNTIKRKGMVLIPVFALHKSTTILQMIYEIFEENSELSHLPVYLDSPMAIESHKMIKNSEKYWDKKWADKLEDNNVWNWNNLKLLKNFKQTAALDVNKPGILVSCSGMLSGGRAIYNLQKMLPNPKNSIIFTGYAPKGTLAHTLIFDSKKYINIQGEYIKSRSQIIRIPFSGHADQNELTEWIKTSDPKKLKKVFLMHGDKNSTEEFCKHLKKELNKVEIVKTRYMKSIKTY